MDEQIKQQIIALIEEEAIRIEYGKLLIEVTVLKGKATNLQDETKRSMNINYPETTRPYRSEGSLHSQSSA